MNPSKNPATRIALVLLATALTSMAFSGGIGAQPTAVHPALANIVATMPAGSWAHVNNTLLSSVWTPADLRPMVGSSNPPPSKVLQPWSSVAYDTRRGDILAYGGGHANYAGNDTYRWRSSTLSWERMSLPSQVQYGISNPAITMAIDGADAAPPSAHTYDNNVFLPLANRMLVWGGAAYNTGSGFQRPDEVTAGAYRLTGPYFFDPAKADPDKVGGTTGSHVKRVAPYPQIKGGRMWENRDLPRYLGGKPLPLFLNGCTASAIENGHDVVYVVGTINGSSLQNVYRYEVVDPADASQDLFTTVGVYWNGANGQTTCGYDPASRLFVRSGSNLSIPFSYWDLTTPGGGNRDAVVANNASISAFTSWMSATGKAMSTCALDFDPVRRQFPVWCGDGTVWVLKAPATNGTTGWTATRQPAPTGAVPFLDPQIFGGVLGKWRYAPGYDVFVAVSSIEGDVWVYKPIGWVAPTDLDQPPTASITAPAASSNLTLNAPISIAVSASDPDGAVTHVRYLANGVTIGETVASPHTTTWTPTAPGPFILTAIATDDQGSSTTSTPVTVTVGSAPVVSITSPAAGAILAAGSPTTLTANASDADGTITSVKFFANGSLIGTDLSAPWSIAWTPGSPGPYSLTALVTDNAGSTGTSSPIAVSVGAGPATSTVTLQRGLNGYSGTADVTLSSYQYQDVRNWGTRPDFREFWGYYTNLIKFRIFQSEGGPVPNGAKIQSATLSIYHELYDYVYELRPMLKPWGEATATWLGPTGGTSAWTSAGASAAGSDYGNVADATVAAPWNAGFIAFDVTSRLQAISSGGANNGWRLLGVSGTNQLRYFRSSEYTDVTTRPKLVVTYTGTGGPAVLFNNVSATGSVSDPTIASVLVNGVATPVTNGQFALGLSLAVGTRSYTVQATNGSGTTTRTVTVTVQ